LKALVSSPWSIVAFPVAVGLVHLVLPSGTFFDWFVAVQVLVAGTSFASTRLTKRPYRPLLLPSIVGGAAFAALDYGSGLAPGSLIVGSAAIAIASYVGYGLAQI